MIMKSISKNILKVVTLLCILTTHLSNGQSNYKLGYQEFQNGKYEKAITHLTTSINDNENLLYSYLYRGMANLYSEKVAQCKLDLDKAFEIDPSSADVNAFYGKYYSAINDFSRALTYFDIAIREDPKNYILYSDRAGAKCMLGFYQGGLEDADIAIKFTPEFNAYTNRGYIKMRTEKYTEAIEDFNKSLELKESHKAYGNRGSAYFLLGKFDLAINDFNKALTFNVNDPLVLYFLGKTYDAMGKVEKACENYLKSKSLGNNQIDDLINKLGCESRK